MRKLIWLVLAASSMLDSQPSRPSQETAVVVVRDASGKLQGFFAPRPDPFRSGLCCPLKIPVPGTAGAKGPDGIVVTAFGYYAVLDGPRVRVHVLALVPKPGAPNRFLWAQDAERVLLQARDFAVFTVDRGGYRDVAEMKTLAIDPIRVSVEKGIPVK